MVNMRKCNVLEFTLGELNKLLKDDNAHVKVKKSVCHIGLRPSCLSDLKTAIHETLNSSLKKFDHKLNGILLSYRNIKLARDVGTILYDDSYIHIDVQADFYVFVPHIGCTLTGIVNKKSQDHIGCLVHKVFNVTIPQPSDGSDEEWMGSSIKIGQEVTFTLEYLDLTDSLPYFRGTLLGLWKPVFKKYKHESPLTQKSTKKKVKENKESDGSFELQDLDTDRERISIIKNEVNIDVLPGKHKRKRPVSEEFSIDVEKRKQHLDSCDEHLSASSEDECGICAELSPVERKHTTKKKRKDVILKQELHNQSSGNSQKDIALPHTDSSMNNFKSVNEMLLISHTPSAPTLSDFSTLNVERNKKTFNVNQKKSSITHELHDMKVKHNESPTKMELEEMTVSQYSLPFPHRKKQIHKEIPNVKELVRIKKQLIAVSEIKHKKLDAKTLTFISPNSNKETDTNTNNVHVSKVEEMLNMLKSHETVAKSSCSRKKRKEKYRNHNEEQIASTDVSWKENKSKNKIEPTNMKVVSLINEYSTDSDNTIDKSTKDVDNRRKHIEKKARKYSILLNRSGDKTVNRVPVIGITPRDECEINTKEMMNFTVLPNIHESFTTSTPLEGKRVNKKLFTSLKGSTDYILQDKFGARTCCSLDDDSSNSSLSRIKDLKPADHPASAVMNKTVNRSKLKGGSLDLVTMDKQNKHQKQKTESLEVESVENKCTISKLKNKNNCDSSLSDIINERFPELQEPIKLPPHLSTPTNPVHIPPLKDSSKKAQRKSIQRLQQQVLNRILKEDVVANSLKQFHVASGDGESAIRVKSTSKRNRNIGNIVDKIETSFSDLNEGSHTSYRNRSNNNVLSANCENLKVPDLDNIFKTVQSSPPSCVDPLLASRKIKFPSNKIVSFTDLNISECEEKECKPKGIQSVYNKSHKKFRKVKGSNSHKKRDRSATDKESHELSDKDESIETVAAKLLSTYLKKIA